MDDAYASSRAKYIGLMETYAYLLEWKREEVMNEESILDRWSSENNRLQQSLEQVEALAGVLIKLTQNEN